MLSHDAQAHCPTSKLIMEYYCHYLSPIGMLTIRCTDDSITGLWIENQKHFPKLNTAIHAPNHPLLNSAVNWLNLYFSGYHPDTSTLPLSPEGTPFQLRVWDELKKIPYGKHVTYKHIASQIGCERGCQAVGGAVSRNPISIIIPCHRVIGSNGSLTGFAGGLNVKQSLLSFEEKSI